jgi:hypothetical protein
MIMLPILDTVQCHFLFKHPSHFTEYVTLITNRGDAPKQAPPLLYPFSSILFYNAMFIIRSHQSRLSFKPVI